MLCGRRLAWHKSISEIFQAFLLKNSIKHSQFIGDDPFSLFSQYAQKRAENPPAAFRQADFLFAADTK